MLKMRYISQVRRRIVAMCKYGLIIKLQMLEVLCYSELHIKLLIISYSMIFYADIFCKVPSWLLLRLSRVFKAY